MSKRDTSFPMQVKPFLAMGADGLHRGDIVLTRSNTLASRVIRWILGGEFSHSALVFFVPHPEEKLENAFLLESVSGGVGLAKFSSYVEKKAQTDIVVLRLEGPEFDDAFFKRVRALMLDRVKAGYDYNRVFRMGLSFLFGLNIGWSAMRQGKDNSMQDAMKRTKRRRRFDWVPPQFICSGFIQYGFVAALLREDRDPALAMFNETITAADTNALLAVTPQDIATSSKLIWKFAIRDGRVYKLQSAEQGIKIISRA
jgi:hypothetical protein